MMLSGFRKDCLNTAALSATLAMSLLKIATVPTAAVVPDKAMVDGMFCPRAWVQDIVRLPSWSRH
jgi:hypothetical protein